MRECICMCICICVCVCVGGGGISQYVAAVFSECTLSGCASGLSNQEHSTSSSYAALVTIDAPISK